MTKRLFIAINLDQPTKLALGKLLVQIPNEPGIAKTKMDNLHLTLQFLGDTEENLIPQIQKILDEVAFQFSSFNMEFTKIGAFPNWQNPNIIWIGINPVQPLMLLQQQISNALTKIVLPIDTKPFHPHLTLSRVKRPTPNIDKLTSLTITIPPTPVQHIDLMASVLTPQGPIYTISSSHRLK